LSRSKAERWKALVRYVVEKIIATKPKNYVQPTLMPSNLSQPLIPATDYRVTEEFRIKRATLH
jgi:hypothetical protein